MFFIPGIVFLRISQNIDAIAAEGKSLSLELAHFYMSKKKNYASLKKSISLWDGNPS